MIDEVDLPGESLSIRMKRNFLTGMIILLPIAVTFIVVLLIIDLLTEPFLEFTERALSGLPFFKTNIAFLTSPKALDFWSRIFILLVLFFIILLLGLFARWFFFKSLIRLGDQVIHKIPVINKLYKTVKEVINVIFTDQTKAFKQVVMVPFPNPDVFSVGFLSRESPSYPAREGKPLTSVFIPTTPNPTTGYLIQFHTEEIIALDMTVEEALKYVVSCGMISPQPPLIERGIS